MRRHLIVIAYALSALVSLMAFAAAILLGHFVYAYYGSDEFFRSGTTIALVAASIPLLLAFIVSGLALVRHVQSQPPLKAHNKICGICGVFVALSAVPWAVIDHDWHFSAAVITAGLGVAAPWFAGR